MILLTKENINSLRKIYLYGGGTDEGVKKDISKSRLLNTTKGIRDFKNSTNREGRTSNTDIKRRIGL
jgi:hypothetical protein